MPELTDDQKQEIFTAYNVMTRSAGKSEDEALAAIGAQFSLTPAEAKAVVDAYTSIATDTAVAEADDASDSSSDTSGGGGDA